MKSDADTTLALMSEFGRLMRSQMRPDDGCPPLSQLHALQFVEEHKAPSMSDLADYLKVKAPSATSLINELVEAKMLTRESDPSDRRQVRLAITPVGRSTMENWHARKKELMQSVLARLGPADRQQLNSLLKKLLDAQAK